MAKTKASKQKKPVRQLIVEIYTKGMTMDTLIKKIKKIRRVATATVKTQYYLMKARKKNKKKKKK